MIVTSDLTFSVAEPGKPTATGTVRSEGSHIIAAVDEPRVVVTSLLGGHSLPVAAPRFLGRRLHESGLDLTVEGPRGTILVIGAGIINPLGRLLTGSWRVRLGRPAALAPLVVDELLRRWRRAHPRR